ncbi:MAG: hypothetical protein RLZZ312_1816 [Bacteroidota bacterium]
MLPTILFILVSIPSFNSNEKENLLTTNFQFADEPTVLSNAENLYYSLNHKSESLPKIETFTNALSGFYNLKSRGLVSNNILTIIDFSLSSASKRLWVIDLSSNKILLNSLVAHGINSGLEFANSFSNQGSSNKSCLGFFVTGEKYIGKNGLSLKLDGLEKGTNDHARSRSVVVHGAYYANSDILQTQNYLGRSQGCPAVPQKINKKLIELIKNKSCLYIYHPSQKFSKKSKSVS